MTQLPTIQLQEKEVPNLLALSNTIVTPRQAEAVSDLQDTVQNSVATRLLMPILQDWASTPENDTLYGWQSQKLGVVDQIQKLAPEVDVTNLKAYLTQCLDAIREDFSRNHDSSFKIGKSGKDTIHVEAILKDSTRGLAVIGLLQKIIGLIAEDANTISAAGSQRISLNRQMRALYQVMLECDDRNFEGRKAKEVAERDYSNLSTNDSGLALKAQLAGQRKELAIEVLAKMASVHSLDFAYPIGQNVIDTMLSLVKSVDKIGSRISNNELKVILETNQDTIAIQIPFLIDRAREVLESNIQSVPVSPKLSSSREKPARTFDFRYIGLALGILVLAQEYGYKAPDDSVPALDSISAQHKVPSAFLDKEMVREITKDMPKYMKIYRQITGKDVANLHNVHVNYFEVTLSSELRIKLFELRTIANSFTAEEVKVYNQFWIDVGDHPKGRYTINIIDDVLVSFVSPSGIELPASFLVHITAADFRTGKEVVL